MIDDGKKKAYRTYGTYMYSGLSDFGFVCVPDGSHNTGNRSTLVHSSAIIDNSLHGGSRSTSRSGRSRSTNFL